MRAAIERLIVLMVVIAIPATATRAAGMQRENPAEEVEYDPLYMGKPLSLWLKYIEDRDVDNIDPAFDAIISLGADAWPAVPQLTQIVAAPFTPIRIGVDNYGSMKSKLFSIDLRANAVDGLAAIGEAAATSAAPLVHWALTIRVIPENTEKIVTAANDQLFVELVALDILQRMHVAAALASFGPAAGPMLASLLAAPDGESRKLAVAILGERSPTIAAVLFRSTKCDDRVLAISILIDLWPVVAKEHLVALKKMFLCAETN